MVHFTTSDNNYGVAKWIVDAQAGQGTHTTIAAALTAASSGDTIFIRPGTYTENLTLKAGVNLCSFECDSTTPNVTIVGKATFTATGTVSIAGIQLKTNSDFFLAVTGTLASVVYLNDCLLNVNNNNGISFTSSNAAAMINCNNCYGDTGTTGITYFASSSAGTINFFYCELLNNGASTTASTISAGFVQMFYCTFNVPITSSGTASVNLFYNQHIMSGNTTALTHGGSGAAHGAVACYFASATASAVSIGATFDMYQCCISTSNTNAITGAGTLNYRNLSFVGTSTVKINTTTQVGGTIQGGVTQAPSAGFLGERLETTATSVATTTATAKTIASVSLTAGIWDVSVLATALPTGGSAIMQELVIGISTTDNTLTGTLGIEQFQIDNVVSGLQACSGSVPSYRVTLTATTTYYLVVKNTYTSTTCPTNARISATRVG